MSCSDVLAEDVEANTTNSTANITSGTYTLFPNGPFNPVYAYCDLETDGGGWTVIMRHSGNDTDFERGWTHYENGFGSLTGSFWLGLKAMQDLTRRGTWSLRIDFESEEKAKFYVMYDIFRLEGDRYTLHLGSYSGNIDDTFRAFNNSSFSTEDMRVDDTENNCPETAKSGWWFHNDYCIGYLFGSVLTSRVSTLRKWHLPQKKEEIPVIKSEMKIRPTSFNNA